jgi:hypothetical protein
MYENDERWLSHKYYVSYMIMQSNMTMMMYVATCSLRWYFPEEERMMQYSRDKYFP